MNTNINDPDALIRGLQDRINRTWALEAMYRAQNLNLDAATQIMKRVALRYELMAALAIT